MHFGSLVAAVASYCDAKANNGLWLLRMEDLDKPREMTGAADTILRTLEAFGFEWNDAIVCQSQRAGVYENSLKTLKNKNVIYACTCSRKEIADSSNAQGIDAVIYPKTCLKHAPETNIHTAFRIMTLDKNITFLDEIQGEITQNLARAVGDFILKRADGLFAYQLAVVVDDAAQGVTHVVRGADLLDSTPRQIYLQQVLGFATPSYAHIPIAANIAGEKLSKQTLAKPIDINLPEHQVFNALSFLGQQPSTELKNANLNEIWRWATSNWKLSQVPKVQQMIVDTN
jgi:glutamyl-Q tRNA(Asp) synthetase